MNKNIIYFDNSATTKVCVKAAEKAFEMMMHVYANPSSLYSFGIEAEKELDHARKSVASLIGCKKEEVIFVSGGTESNNLAILGAAEAYKRRGNHIVTTEIEHPSVLEAVSALEKRGWEVTRIAPDKNGCIGERDVLESCTENTVLVSVMAANNETGNLTDTAKLSKRIKKKFPQIIIHCDAVQAVCTQKIDVSGADIDLLSISGHKIFAPKGCGVLYKRAGVKLAPQTFGGNQELGFRSGTENVPAICALGVAVKELGDAEKNHHHYTALRDFFLENADKRECVKVNSYIEKSVPNIVNISVCGLPSEVMLNFFASHGIFVASGSACAKGVSSHVLKAMKLTYERANSALRISFSRDNTKLEILKFFEVLDLAINILVRR